MKTDYPLANIPHQDAGFRVVGFKIQEGDELYGTHGLSEPVTNFRAILEAGIKNHDGQKLLVQHILDTDSGLSENSRKILEELIK